MPSTPPRIRGRRARRQRRPSRSASRLRLPPDPHRILPDALREIAPDVEAQVFHGRVPPELEPPRRHPVLNSLAYRPVLAVDEIPEVDGVRRVEVRFRD